ncbi:MAG: DUF4168 domain-containing protein [Weeksellaceae bacterium]|jgi:hypothetical protein|nr:DUF4168 domain-containing protein [Weeksellaceae bacterium]
MKYLGVFLVLLGFSTLHAQEITDYDLRNFAFSYKEMMRLNTEAQNEMAKLISDAKLDLDTYHIIDQSKDSDYIPDFSESDFEKYNSIQPKIEKIQKQLEERFENVLKRNDLDKQKYRAIAERVQHDYILQNKLDRILASLP